MTPQKDNSFVEKVISKLNSLITARYDIHLCWIPVAKPIKLQKKISTMTLRQHYDTLLWCDTPYYHSREIIMVVLVGQKHKEQIVWNHPVCGEITAVLSGKSRSNGP